MITMTDKLEPLTGSGSEQTALARKAQNLHITNSSPANDDGQDRDGHTDRIYQRFLREKVDTLKQCLDKPRLYTAHLDDFNIIGFLGEGGFGQVWQVEHKVTMTMYALKVQSKAKIMRRKSQLNRLFNERNIHASVNFTFIVRLFFSFKDNACVYLVLEHMSCGTLFQVHHSSGEFNEEKSRFFVGQVVLALEYLHNANIVYRDLKPENLLLDIAGYLKVSDFGFAKRLAGVTYTFCGTDEYMAPEVLTRRGYEKGPDWWAVGILTYELICGYSPFRARKPEQIYQRIKCERVIFPSSVTITKKARNFILQLLEKNCATRLGMLFRGSEDVKQHEWFRGISWMALYDQVYQAPLIPKPFESQPRDLSKWPRSNVCLFENEFANF